MRLVAIVALSMSAVPALAKPKPAKSARPPSAAWNVRLQQAAVLQGRPTEAEVESLLISGRWMEPNPNKETSTWESHWYELRADHTLTQSGDLVGPPREMAWKVVSAGAKPVIDVDGQRYTLGACELSNHTVTTCWFRARRK